MDFVVVTVMPHSEADAASIVEAVAGYPGVWTSYGQRGWIARLQPEMLAAVQLLNTVSMIWRYHGTDPMVGALRQAGDGLYPTLREIAAPCIDRWNYSQVCSVCGERVVAVYPIMMRQYHIVVKCRDITESEARVAWRSYDHALIVHMRAMRKRAEPG